MTARRFANPIFVALDTPDLALATALVNAVRPYVGGVKVGLEFISSLGPAGVRELVGMGLPVFADVKLHDIPNTVSGAVREVAKLGVAMLNVHAAGGEAMLRAAKEAAASVDPKVRVLAVTVLTSMTDDDLRAVGQGDSVALQVGRLARLAQTCGLDGVVCSPREIEVVRRACGDEFLVVTPGVRPAGAALADQRRVMSPREAIAYGADILVIGRPITAAINPAEAAAAIAEDVAPARAA
ncbi:MAG: orotidine-5'-phosphate decarboxylase [Alphaproteobacteria bacterium]|nr:orotidine-5'-phosphate decarboxylase [Alphaproteobacteria bacterium]